MKSRTFIILVLSVVSFCMLASVMTLVYYSQWVPFVPIDGNIKSHTPMYVERPDYDNPEFRQALQTVLETYNEPYYVDSKQLYIRKSLAMDKDLLMNYTTKAHGLMLAELKVPNE